MGEDAAISIHPPLAGRDCVGALPEGRARISIHPPLAGRDSSAPSTCRQGSDFNPPAPCGAGRKPRLRSSNRRYFNPPAPCGAGLRYTVVFGVEDFVISIHPPLAGRDSANFSLRVSSEKFQSTRPLRGGTRGDIGGGGGGMIFQSTRPLRGGTIDFMFSPPFSNISIHPPLAGRDKVLPSGHQASEYFNPPAPCGAGHRMPAFCKGWVRFQSTRPLRGGTDQHFLGHVPTAISIHPPLAGRDPLDVLRYYAPGISIHPPLAGRDNRRCSWVPRAWYFNPPAPCGAGRRHRCPGRSRWQISIHPPLAGRDAEEDRAGAASVISIHPPLAGRDKNKWRRRAMDKLFQSTRPLRGGTSVSYSPGWTFRFQSTRPLRGGTGQHDAHVRHFLTFQSTRPLRGGTHKRANWRFSHRDFNPPAPCGAGQRDKVLDLAALRFQSTRPLRGGTQTATISALTATDFNPPAPCGAGPKSALAPSSSVLFQSTRPLRGGTIAFSIRFFRFSISIHPPLAGRDGCKGLSAE